MQKNKMASAAFVFGIISFILSFLLGGGILFGLLGITFALLSRGAYSMSKRARTGFILSLIGTVLSTIILFVFLVLTILLSIRANYRNGNLDKFIGRYEEYEGFENYFNFPFEYPDDFEYDIYDYKGGNTL